MKSHIIRGDVLEVLRRQPDASFDAAFCDPPYGLSFMGKTWDHGVPGPDVWREVLRALKPGAALLAFGGTRTYHRLACAIEDAGFIISDTVCWLYGQGFPKGHGQLKPAWEPITLAWKKGSKRVLAIDAGRIPTGKTWHRPIGSTPKFASIFAQDAWTKEQMAAGANTDGNELGRWPANVILDERAAAALDEQTGMLTSGNNPSVRHAPKTRDIYGLGFGEQCLVHRGTDSGGASRFFYVAKASRKERGEGNTHPTVKPIKLTEYLARLILPPERDTPRRILIPFAGSGSEMIGAKRAGWDHVTGIEREREYVAIAKARLAKAA